jgi:Icc-related predicted phosphoesterase
MKMTKREFLKVFTVTGTSLAIGRDVRLFGADTVVPPETHHSFSLPRFAVMSDAHFGTASGYGSYCKVSRALRNIVQKGNLDAIFVVGDLTENGTAKQYDQLWAVFKDENIIPVRQRVVFMMGNHEYHSKENSVDNYTTKIKQPLHQYIDIKGYPFITLSMSNRSGYDNEVKLFLAEKMEDASKKYVDKPIFIFSHIPPANTCYGSKSDGNSVFLSILEQYPQAVFFSGHTHTPIGDPRTVWQGDFTSINDGSTCSLWSESGEVDNETGGWYRHGDNTTEAMIVNVRAGSLLDIERWDTFHNEPMPNLPVDWKNKNYRNRIKKTVPTFADGVKPTVQITGNGCIVTFPQARDEEVVFRYFVEIKDGGKTVTLNKKSSEFFLNSMMPEKLSVDFFSLPPGKKLTANVTALDSFNNKSATIVSNEFIIEAFGNVE